MDADVNFYWKKLTIGSEIDAVRYAIKNKTFILFNRDPYFHSYEYVSADSSVNLEAAWAQEAYQLHAQGLHPFTNQIRSIRFNTDKDIVKVTLQSGTVYAIKYDDVVLFDMKNIFGLPASFTQDIVSYRVLDWFDIRRHGSVPMTMLQDSSSTLAHDIRFFQSTRRDGEHATKDLVAESSLSFEQLHDVGFTDTVIRFKIKNMLREKGINDIELAHWKRDVYPVVTGDSKKSGKIRLVGAR